MELILTYVMRTVRHLWTRQEKEMMKDTEKSFVFYNHLVRLLFTIRFQVMNKSTNWDFFIVTFLVLQSLFTNQIDKFKFNDTDPNIMFVG